MGKVRRKTAPMKVLKPAHRDEHHFAQLQFVVPESVEKSKKVRPQEVFEGFKDNKKKTKQKKSGKPPQRY